MHVPEAFRLSERGALAMIDAHPFATVVALPSGDATHIPVLRDGNTLFAHVARASGMAREVLAGAELLAIFRGVHGYVSPRWYRSAPQVPTWNYEAVHARGRARAIEDPDRVRAILAELAVRFEPDGGWTIDAVPDPFARSLARAIVAFELPIETLEGKAKLGQNRSDEDREGAIEGLRGAGEQALADAMSRALVR